MSSAFPNVAAATRLTVTVAEEYGGQGEQGCELRFHSVVTLFPLGTGERLGYVPFRLGGRADLETEVVPVFRFRICRPFEVGPYTVRNSVIESSHVVYALSHVAILSEMDRPSLSSSQSHSPLGLISRNT